MNRTSTARGCENEQQSAQRPRISDTELLKKQLVVSDPESLSGLTKELPPDYDAAVIEFWYDVTPPSRTERPFVWCAHDRYATHWHGYVMKTPTGTRFLIGKDCGKKLFGLDFNLVEREFLGLRSRQNYLNRIEAALVAFPAAIKAVSSLTFHPTVDAFQKLKAVIERGMPKFFERVSKAVMYRNGTLIVEERVRDIAAEERRASRVTPEDEALRGAEAQRARGEITLTQLQRARELHREYRRIARENHNEDDGPIFKTIEKAVGTVAGGDLFRAEPPLRDSLKTLLMELRALHDDLKGESERLSNRKLMVIFSKLNACIEKIEAHRQRLYAPIKFFAGGNLATVAKWVTNQPGGGGEYRANGASLVWNGPDRDVQVSVPAGYEVLELPELEVLKMAASARDK